MSRKVLFISYFTGVMGNCPAEWADDKLHVLKNEQVRTYVVTGFGSSARDCSWISYFKCPSIASDDFRYESELMAKDASRSQFKRLLMLPIIFVFGGIMKWLTDKITRGGSCQWSWIITAFPVALYIVLTRRVDVIFCTGGPPSAHLVGSLISYLSRAKLIHEFQDPLIGSEINRSELKRRVTSIFEKFFIGRGKKTVFVTRKASDDAKSRHQEFADTITHCYPGARKFNTTLKGVTVSKSKHKRSLEIVHMGTLYGTRNLDLFFEALDELYVEKKVSLGDLKIVNLGSVYCDRREAYLQREDFKTLDEMSRREAVERASKADAMLIVQHADSRSLETIPYKSYDYLNLNLPIFGLIDNPELNVILNTARRGATIANPSDKSQIKSSILQTISLCKDGAGGELIDIQPLRIETQFLQVLNMQPISKRVQNDA